MDRLTSFLEATDEETVRKSTLELISTAENVLSKKVASPRWQLKIAQLRSYIGRTGIVQNRFIYFVLIALFDDIRTLFTDSPRMASFLSFTKDQIYIFLGGKRQIIRDEPIYYMNMAHFIMFLTTSFLLEIDNLSLIRDLESPEKCPKCHKKKFFLLSMMNWFCLKCEPGVFKVKQAPRKTNMAGPVNRRPLDG